MSVNVCDLGVSRTDRELDPWLPSWRECKDVGVGPVVYTFKHGEIGNNAPRIKILESLYQLGVAPYKWKATNRKNDIVTIGSYFQITVSGVHSTCSWA